MKTAGIIAEYNPFHNGHQYHIEETRRRTGADYVIVALSGDFVQRGAPALLDKYDRARTALLHGADLVFELPAVAALQSAQGFARGGISLLDGLGVVDAVSCGCESAGEDPQLFAQVTALLAEEPADYRDALSDALRAGRNFPAAREAAVRSCIRDACGAQPDASGRDALGRLLSEPNNILALEYAVALKRRGSRMDLCLIPRAAARSSDGVPSGSFAAAASIRSLLFSREADPDAALRSLVPADIRESLIRAQKENRLLREDDFSDLLLYALTSSRDRLADFGPEHSDLANRTAKLTEQFTDWTGFTELLKTKNQTYTAISRYLAQILLGIRREDLSLAAACGNVPCARLLGFRKEAAPLLKSIQDSAAVPVLTRPARDYPALDETKRHLYDFDIRAAALYRQVLQSHSGVKIKSEFRQPVLTI